MAGRCLCCDRDSDQVPLVEVSFRGESFWICPQHLPILIHNPAQLAGKLPGADGLTGAGGHGRE